MQIARRHLARLRHLHRREVRIAEVRLDEIHDANAMRGGERGAIRMRLRQHV